MKVHIIAIDTGNEPHALRAAAEAWGADVSVTWVGNSDQIVSLLSSRPTCDIMFISGHGDGNSILLPPLAASVQQRYRYTARITADQISDFMKLPPCHVVNLSCEGGSQNFASAFLSGGATSYCGSTAETEGSAALMYGLQLLYSLVVAGKTIREAHDDAGRHDDDRGSFRLYMNDQGSSDTPIR